MRFRGWIAFGTSVSHNSPSLDWIRPRLPLMSFLRANTSLIACSRFWLGAERRSAALLGLCTIISMPLLGAVALRAAEPLPPSIRVVMDNNYPPFVMQAEGGLRGILVDQWRVWEVKTGIKVELTGLDWGEALRRMQAGEFDVIDTAFHTPERAEYLSFSKPYQKIDVPIFFSREITGITDAKSLRGFPVGVKTGDADIDFLRRSGVETLLEFGSYELVLQAARDHKISVFVVDLPPALYFLHKFGLQGEFRHSAPLLVGELHRGVARGNTKLLHIVEDGFARITPTEYKAIEEKWYGAENFRQRSLHWLMPVAAGFSGVVLFLFLWNRMLRRTVRQRTAELTASQELFQSIYHSVNDAIFIHDLATGAVVDVNDRMCAMFGCSREEVLRESIRQFSQGDSPYGEAEALAWLRLAAAGQPQTFAWHCRRKDGSLFWGEVSMRRATIGSAERIVVTVRDRTGKQEEENALRARVTSQERLEAIADASPGVMYVRRRRPDGLHSYLYASPRIEEIYSIRRDDLLKDGEAIFRIVHPDDLARLQNSIAEAARTLDEWTFSYRIIHPKKGIVWVDGRATLRREPDGGTLWHGFSYDVTDRVNAVAKLKKANAVLQIRAACDQALVRADDEQTLFRSVCETAVTAGGYRMAWIGLAENDENCSVRRAMVSGHDDGYTEDICITWSDTKSGQGPVGTAIRTGSVVVAQDIATNPAFLPWRTEALNRGYGALVAIPFSCDGKTIGMLAIYSTLPADFTPDDVAVFTELVANLGVRLEAIRAKEMRLRAEMELRKSQEQLRATLDALPDLLFEVDRAGRVHDFRAPNRDALFAPPETFLGRTFADFLPAEAVAVITHGLAEAAEKGRHFGGIYSLPMPDGLKWFELSISPKGEPAAETRSFIVLIRDVTQRVKAELSLRESERYNRTLFNQTPIGLLLCRMDGRLVDINPAFARIIGYTVEEALRLTYWDITPRSYANQEAQQLESLRTTGRYGPYEKQYIHRDGHLVPVRLTGLILKQQGNEYIWSSIEDITERKQAEAALRLSADRLAQAVLVSQIGVFDHDHETHAIYCSPVLESIFGVSSDQVVRPADWIKCVHPKDQERVKQAVQRSLDPVGDGLLDTELQIVRADGNARNVTARAQTIFTGTGGDRRPMRTVGAVVDITGRRLAEEALKASTEQIQHVLGAADCLLWQSRLTRTEVGEFDWQIYIPRSSLYRRLFGKDPSTPSLLPWKELKVPELHAMHQTCQAALVSGAPGYEQEFHAVIGGQTIWLREQVSIKCEGDMVWVLVGVITDITERKAAEATLRASETRLAGIIDSAMDAIITADEDGKIVVFNHAAESIFRCPANAAIGRSIDQFIPKSMQTIHAEHLRPEIEKQDPGRIVRSVSGFGLRADGAEFPCEASVSQIEIENRRLFTVILRDVTDRVRAEAERKALQDQVLRSQRLESVGRLAGGIAHDLNNILAPIVLGAPMLRESLHDAEARDMLNAMEISANRGARIIAQLLTFSRGGVGERVTVQLPLIVRDMETIIRETFPKKITVQTTISSDVWKVRADPTQLHQVLMNLCVNARDAMPRGGVLTLALDNLNLDQTMAGKIPGLQPGAFVRLSVTDTGTGINPEVIDKIYDPFFTTKEVGKGTGLGLSTVLGIVRAHGGAVQAGSIVGDGTRFDVYLPAELNASATAEAARVAHAAGNGELILFVDDEPAVRLVARRLLEQHGYRVVEAADGSEALLRYKQLRPGVALVVTDLIMPVLDGPGLILELKKIDPALPVIAASGHAAGVDPVVLLEIKCQALLQKPFEITELLREINRVLHPHPAPTA